MSNGNNTIDEILKILKDKKPLQERLQNWIPTILFIIMLVTMITDPFNKQKDDIHSIRTDLDAVQYVVWSAVPGADVFLTNPYKVGGGKTSYMTRPYEKYMCKIETEIIDYDIKE